MATEERLRYIIESIWKGGRATAQASEAYDDVADAARRSGKEVEDTGQKTSKQRGSWLDLAGGIYVAQEAYQIITGAIRQASEMLEEGAALEKAEMQFENLAASIGTTADSIMSDMSRATNDMMSDAEMISSASEIISLGLADSQEGVVRLATAVSTLGLDMQQVIMTFANNSTMRLDALGLSVEDVQNKVEELNDEGFEGDAFDQAVLIALEEKMELLGDASQTTAGDLKVLKAELENVRNEMILMATEEAADEIEQLADGAGESAVEFIRFAAGVQRVNEALTPLAEFMANPISENPLVWTIEATQEQAQATEYMTSAAEDADQAMTMMASNFEARYIPTISEYGVALEDVFRQGREAEDTFVSAADRLDALAAVTEDTTSSWEHYNEVLERTTPATEEQIAATQELVSSFQAAGDLAAAVVNAEDIEAQTEALEELQDSYEQTAMDALLMGSETQEGFEQALEASVAIGAISQEQADLQLQAANTETAIGRLNEALMAGDIDVSGYQAAFQAISEGGATFEEAVSGIQEFGQEMDSRFGGDEGIAVDVDTADAETRMENLRTKAEEIAAGEYVIEPIAEVASAEGDITHIKGLAEDLAGTYDVVINVTQSGEFPDDVPGGSDQNEGGSPPPPNQDFAHGTGGEFYEIPPGFQNDTFTAGFSSGEQIMVTTPADQARGVGGGPMIGQIVFQVDASGQSNPGAIAAQIAGQSTDKIKQVLAEIGA